jgi:4-amino-4-deoxy-L-arabinose transferase-like glycosyltransferase
MNQQTTDNRSILLPRIVLILTLIILFIAFLFFYTRGFIPHDEGYVLSPAQRIAQGDIPYLDFHYTYTPGAAYVIAFGYRLFGVSIIASRYITMLFALATVYILILTAGHLSRNHYAYILPVFLYAAWGPMHINFAWPVIYACFSGLWTCLILLKSKENKLLFFLAGVTTGLTLLFKQNFGVALILNNIIFFYVNNRAQKNKLILIYIAGICVLPVILGIYFLVHHALIPFFNDMYFFMIAEILFKGQSATPFIYPDVWYKQILRTGFYLFPLAVSLWAIFITVKKNRKILFLASYTGLYYIFSIRPTTDFTHLAPLIAISGIPLLLVIKYVSGKASKAVCIIIFVFYILLGGYNALFGNYYRWNPPIIDQHYYTNNPRLGILTDKASHGAILNIDNYLDTHKTKNNYMFIDLYAPSYYILTGKKNPTKFIFFEYPILSVQNEEEIIQDLKEKEVPLVFADLSLKTDSSILAKFIKSHYHAGYRADGYLILQQD